MNTKFTKGPWRAEYDKVFHGRFVVAQCNAGVSVGINEMILRRNANAALIASAPELYEALEQIAALYIDDRSSSMHKALCIANKALKKARGEA
mgnify:CR=1 FL=1